MARPNESTPAPAVAASEEKQESKEDPKAKEQELETVSLVWSEELAVGANAPNPCDLSASTGEATLGSLLDKSTETYVPCVPLA